MTTDRRLMGLSILIAFFLSGECTIATQPAKSPLYVSLIQLIANPRKYEGMEVRVRGYYEPRHECNALYLSKDDADYHVTMNAVGCDFWGDKLSQSLMTKPLQPPLVHNKSNGKWESSGKHSKFVVVEGIFGIFNSQSGEELPGEIRMRKIIEIPPPGTY